MVEPALGDRFCELSERERDQRRAALASPEAENYCQGCLKNATCAYGSVFEPDRQIIAGRVHNGMRDGLRGITLAPEFPLPTAANPGDRFLLRLLGIGSSSCAMLDMTTEAIDILGKSRGLGPNRVKFAIDHTSVNERTWQLDSHTLPRTVTGETVPWMRLDLETPVFIKKRKERVREWQAPLATPDSRGTVPGTALSGARRTSRRHFAGGPDEAPTLADFVRESIRTVRRALNEYNAAGVEMSFDPWQLLSAADSVRQEHGDWTIFKQSRISARQQARWEPSGWIGSGVYRDVPTALLPWLTWGGRLGIGDSRNCGAGLWHLVLA